MEIDILDQKENKVLDRTEIKFNCTYSGEATPKLLDVKSKLVALLDTKKGLIVIDSIQPHFGETKAAGYAKIYGSEESLKDIETEHVIAKNKEAETPADDNDAEESEEATEDELDDVAEATEYS
ncbi:30S ribosomal protein S24e [Methanobrevibacter cuticularis]|uniref:Small ribosomal subunit protein eS24 n=1 Tax=Methanobrevibacter cuticularis TaxID=47311 RepID=A0A166EZ54_9EURY|nr:30S ribosomal protein S24e [Methanobrevibacter cuticularis]KZX17161.1 30S ribosomal protein S24e [Methanobrevibacter cuticularis]